MQIFDFDGTLFDGDSTFAFWRFALRRQPVCICALPRQVSAAVLYAARRISRDEFKERFYVFLRKLPDVEGLVSQFWDTNWDKIKPEVSEFLQKGDVIASASPEFLLKPAAERLGAHLIVSKVDLKTGRLLGPNCRDVEKARRIREAGFAGDIDAFFTDSVADAAPAAMAKRAFMVKGTQIQEWTPPSLS